MAKLMAERLLLSFGNSREEIRRSFDLICFVPSTKEKMLERGYNQAYLLAKYLSKELEIPVASLLRKVKDTPPARLAGRLERRDLLEGAFAISGESASVEGKSILLADDVFTTGSTANEAALTLKAAGCSRVSVIVFASGNGKHDEENK